MGLITKLSLFAFLLILAYASANPNPLQDMQENELVPSPPFHTGLTSPITSLSPIQVFHNIVKRVIVNFLRIIQQTIRRIQHWVIHTSNYLELLEAKNMFGPLFNKILHRVVAWMRSFASTESDCIGRVLCEMTDQASHYIPSSLKQVALIYFSSNQGANMYYQPLANGFVNSQSCSLLYARCNHEQFFAHLDQFNVSVPEFMSRAEVDQVVTSSFGMPMSSRAEVTAQVASVVAPTVQAPVPTPTQQVPTPVVQVVQTPTIQIPKLPLPKIVVPTI